MSTNVDVMARRFCGAIFLVAIAAAPGCPCLAQDDSSISYQGVMLQPGDVINFLGGPVTRVSWLTYGHAAVYLGFDPQRKERIFLDFTVAKYGDRLTYRPYSGRLTNETDFLRDNASSHTAFDVFRLRGSPAIDQAKMRAEARRIAEREWYLLSGEVCSTAVAAVLSAGTGTTIDGFTPDDLTGGQFERHPQLGGKAISVKAALQAALARESERSPAAGGETSFLEGIDGRVPQQAVETFAANEAAMLAEWQRSPEYAAYRARLAGIERGLNEVAAQEEINGRWVRDHFVDMENRWAYLKDMTGLACSDPDAMERLGREGRATGVSLVDLDLEYEIRRTEAASTSERPAVSYCQKYLLTAMLEANGLTSGAAMMALARRYRAEHPGLIKRFATKIADFLASFAPDASDPPGGGGATGAGSSASRARNYAHSPDNWSSLNQLRGVAGFGH